jgi:tRNA G18 (ribose-2'-O)-methylase SpoU
MSKKKIFVILDNIRSRENVGSIFRTADAVGVSKIFLCGITPTPTAQFPISNFQFPKQSKLKETDKIAKTALGAEKWVPWEYHKQIWRLLKQLKGDGVSVVALEQTTDARNIFARGALARAPLALVLGNEVRGLSSGILKLCDKKIYIPMYGKKESLNVAVAAGIALYQLRK